MFVFPTRTGTPLPSVFTKYADGPEPPVHAPAGRDRGQARRVDRAVDRHRAAVSERATTTRSRLPGWAGWRTAADRRGPGRVPRACSSRGRSSRSSDAASAPQGALDLDPLGQVLSDPGLRHVAWFTVWQATLSTVPHAAHRDPGRVRAEPVPVPRPRARARAGHRPVRAADDRGRRRVQRARHHGVGRGDPPRPRLLQLRGRRAHRRRPLVPPRPAARRGRADARCEPVADVRRRHAARPPTRDHRRRVDRLPVLLHLVRRDPRARRPARTRRSRPRSTGRPRSC